MDPVLFCGFEHLDNEKLGQKDASFVIPIESKYSFFTVMHSWPLYNLSIAVLSGARTASSGEIILIGNAGVPTGPAPFKLPHGGSFAIPNSRMFDRIGISYETFIDPDVIVHNPNNDHFLSSGLVIMEARGWLI